MNPSIKNFIKHPFCSNRIEKFCKKLEQADIHQNFPIPKNLTTEEKQIIHDLLENGYIAYDPDDPDSIIKCTFYPHALQTVYDCMQKGSSINKNRSFYESLIADCKYDAKTFTQIFIDALCTQNIIWIVNNLTPLFDYLNDYGVEDFYIEDVEDVLYNALFPLIIYSCLHPERCTTSKFKIPTETQQKQFLSNISLPNPIFYEHCSSDNIYYDILLLKYLLGISDAYVYLGTNEHLSTINHLFKNHISKFNITCVPSFVPRIKHLIDIRSIEDNAKIDFNIRYLSKPWFTADLIAHLCQYHSAFKQLPSNLKIIQYLLQNHASEKALELLELNFLNAEEYPLLLNNICSESFKISAEDKTQVMNFLLQYIPDSSH